MKRLWQVLISLDAGLWLLGGVSVSLAVGSFLLVGEPAAAINEMPLFAWLREVPLALSWWLWLAVVLLALLGINTACCSADTLADKFRRAAWMPLLAPQLMHAGFLLVVLAHLVSSLWGFKQTLQLAPGMEAALPSGRPFLLGRVEAVLSPRGMPIGSNGQLFVDPRDPAARVTISPNRPWFADGYGVYLKHAEQYPQPWALFEIHREPGAGLALAGSMLFSAGMIMLLWLRSKAREIGRTGEGI